jgi:OOP family OmpA-OmpF porin
MKLAISASILVVLSMPLVMMGQDNVRTQLFEEANRVLEEAKAKQADLYAPRSFAEAMEKYTDANDYFQRGKSLEDIREKLSDAISLFRKALSTVRIGEATFSAVMAARSDAISADSPKYAADLWRQAEERFRSAAEQLEDGDMNDARKEGREAENLYRNAELDAIKANFLNPARSLLVVADQRDVKDNAPKTLALARQLAAQAESLLQQNRYDTDEARQIAQQAKYEAAHAIYLNDAIKQMKKQDMEFEDVLLAAEAPLKQIADVMEIPVEFDKGLGPATEKVLAEVKKREKDIAQLGETKKRQLQEIENLRQQVASMEGRLGSLTDTERDLQQRLELQRHQEEIVASVTAMFTDDEASILREGNNVVIRLYGLNFPVGRNIIEPQYFPLLTKVSGMSGRHRGAHGLAGQRYHQPATVRKPC